MALVITEIAMVACILGLFAATSGSRNRLGRTARARHE